MKDNWKDSYDIIWQMSADHIADNGAGCYGKMGMVKKELQAFISNLLAEQKKELLGEIKRYQPSISKEIDTYLLQKAQDDVSLKHHD